MTEQKGIGEMATNQELGILVEKIREGDGGAFSALYDATCKTVFYHAKTVLKNEEDIEDAVQESYEQLFLNLDSLRSPEAVASWLNQTVTYISLKKVRGQKGKDSFSLDDEDFFFEPEAPESETPGAVMERKGTEEIIGSIIRTLPEAQRTAVVLYYYDEMSVADIAKAMECSEGTVKSRLNYARRTIEKAVRAEEKRSGIKLYSVSPALILAAIRRMAEEEGGVVSEHLVARRLAEKLGDTAQATGPVRPSGSPSASSFGEVGKGAPPNSPGGQTVYRATNTTGAAGAGGQTTAVKAAAAGGKALAASGSIVRKAVLLRAAAVLAAAGLGLGVYFSYLRPPQEEVHLEQPTVMSDNNLIDLAEEPDTEEEAEIEEEETAPVSLSPGSYVTIGSYEQDNNAENGTEPIEWMVMREEDDRVLLLSRYGLDSMQYSTGTSTVWSDSLVRQWLNGTFYEEAFTEEERNAILQTEVDNGGSQHAPDWMTSGGFNTEDLLFVPSYAEARDWFATADERICMPTAYAVAQGATTDPTRGSCQWWERSPGRSQTFAGYVATNGDPLKELGISGRGNVVRPAMWVDRSLDALRAVE